MAISSRSLTMALAVLLFALVLPSETRHVRRPAKTTTADISKYTPSLSNGSDSLTPPTGTLKAIAIGRGTQNYTCEPGSTGAPVAIGAKAELLDASVLLPLFPPNQSQKILDELPNYFINYDYAAISNSSIPCIGQHYFANTGPAPVNGTPTFDLGSIGFLSGKKTGDIKAPKGAGVDWLQLVAKAPSRILTEVYRVNTAKGQAPKSCAGQPANIQVQYAALYWFYA